MTASGPFEIASFGVREAVAGDRTHFLDGRLEVGVPELEAAAAGEPGLRGVRISIVRPGEPVRVANVLDAVEPAVKAFDPEATFPGALGAPGVAGSGRTNRLDGVAVLSAADLIRGRDEREEIHDSLEFHDSFVDMDGPGAGFSLWSSTINVVAEFDADPATPFARVDASIRRSTLRLARDLAAATLPQPGGTAGTVETLEIGPASRDLPGVCVILQLTSEGPGLDSFVYGEPAAVPLPRAIDAREVLDGAITSGAYESPAARNPTYVYQRSSLLRTLIGLHGVRLRLTGVVLTLGYLEGYESKRAMAERAAGLAAESGAAGAILTTYSLGNSHTDTMLTVQACERLGIRTAAIVAEEGGLTDHVPEADAIVSAGNVMELVPAWRPGRVLGKEPAAAAEPAPVPVLSYVGASTQLGDMRLRGVTS